MPDVVTDTEAKEILRETQRFEETIEAWVAQKHPQWRQETEE
jgi:hypothetical protein